MELTTFIGRRRELAEIRSLMSRGRLVTLAGMGGVGKTRLSRQVALAGRRAFADGAWQVELADLHEPALLVPTIASALGLREQTEISTFERLQTRLRDRSMLLVLDNCEHLIGPVAEIVEGLARRCPQLHILATSREALRLPGEQVYTVLPFAVPDGTATSAADLMTNDSVTLFLHRAAEVVPDFTLGDENAADVAALCRRLDGVPLAIELAAAWLRTLSAQDLLEQLAEHVDLLGRRYRNLSHRQQSLSSLVDWSYQLCDPDERALWRAASVFAQGFELDAAASVSSGGHELAGLRLVEVTDQLVAKSILFADRTVHPVRFRMPQLIRDHGLRRLAESGQELLVRLAHRDWCVSLAAEAEVAWVGPGQLGWFTRIRRELANIRAAVKFSLTRPGGEVQVVEIISSLISYWIALGFLSEGSHWLQAARAQGLADGYQLTAMRTEAMLATVQGDRQLVEDTLGSAWELAAGASDRDVAWLRFASARAAIYADESTARDQLEDATRRFRAVGDIAGLVWALCAVITVEATSSDPRATLDRFADYCQVADPHGESWTRSYSLFAVAFAHWRAGDRGAAMAALRESLRLRAPFEDDFMLGQGLELLSWISAAGGDPTEAAALMGRADSAFFAAGSSVTAVPFLTEAHEDWEQGLREQLGPDAFQTAYQRGQAQRPSDYEVLVENGTIRREGTGTGTSPLTRREEEVATLVADGLSNKEIATRLLIAPRTAETHIEHILVKLGCTSRTQVARWVANRRQAASAS